MPAKVDASDDLLADVTAFVVRDQVVNSEFRNDGRLIHINAVFWNSGLDTKYLVKFIVDLLTIILFLHRKEVVKLGREIIRYKISGSVRQFECDPARETVAHIRVIDVLLWAKDLKI